MNIFFNIKQSCQNHIRQIQNSGQNQPKRNRWITQSRYPAAA